MGTVEIDSRDRFWTDNDSAGTRDSIRLDTTGVKYLKTSFPNNRIRVPIMMWMAGFNQNSNGAPDTLRFID